MSANRDPEIVLAAWLDEGPLDLPDEARRAILAALPTTLQARRGPLAPRRLLKMNGYARLAAAAVVAALAVGGALFVVGPRFGVGNPSPTPAITPVPTPTPTPATFSRIIDTTDFEVPFSISVPAAWTGYEESADWVAFWLPKSAAEPRTPRVGINLLVVDNVYRDVCDPDAGLLDPPLGSTTSDLVDFLLAAEPLHATTLSPSKIGDVHTLAVSGAMTSTDRCQGGMVLWPTARGPYVVFSDDVEFTEFLVTDVGGRRLVATIVGDPEFGPHDAGHGVLTTVDFR